MPELASGVSAIALWITDLSLQRPRTSPCHAIHGSHATGSGHSGGTS